ncbi:MAG: hypothetical protein EBU90_30935, partial [Proteobacteria bacterium]|nr:hypothetical protein [Pseudomonadota bacterium]
KDFLLNTIQNQLNNIAGLVSQMVNQKLAELGMIVGVVFGILKAAQSIIDTVKNLLYSLDKRASDINTAFENNLNCATVNALLTRCLQAQVNNLLTNKIVSALGVTKTVDDLTNYTQSSLSNNTDVFAKFTNKMAQEVNKANLQLSLVNNKPSF